MGKLTVTGWRIFLPEKSLGSFLERSSQGSLGFCELIEWDTRQEQQAANLLIVAWLSDITFLFAFLGLDQWLCICNRTNQGTLSQSKRMLQC